MWVPMMKILSLLFHMAVSVLVAPTPGLVILLYANGGGSIPPVQGVVVVLASVAAYWAWQINRTNKADIAERQEAARHALIDRPEGFGAMPAGAGGPASTDLLPARSASAGPVSAVPYEVREARNAMIRGHEDLVDPVAQKKNQPPRKILIDRIADLRQLKRLVAEHETPLLNAFHRTVARDEYGAPDYKEWAYEADRFLLSSAFAARTLNRHEAIATLTAEVEHISTFGMRAVPREPRKLTAETFVKPEWKPAPIGAAPMPAEELSQYAIDGTGAGQSPAHVGKNALARRLARRMAEHRTRTFTETCTQILAEHGWQTQATDAPGTDAIDLFAERGDMIVGLRCRAGEREVDEADVRDALMAQERFGLDSVAIVSKSGFSKAARALAANTSAALLDPTDVADLHLFIGQKRKTVVPLFKEAGGQR